MPKDQRTKIMRDVWNFVKHNYSNNIVDRVVHKDTHKFTTSKEFKQEIEHEAELYRDEVVQDYYDRRN